MKINEVEKQTGISKQNIRFYEKKGLLNVIRQIPSVSFSIFQSN